VLSDDLKASTINATSRDHDLPARRHILSVDRG